MRFTAFEKLDLGTMFFHDSKLWEKVSLAETAKGKLNAVCIDYEHTCYQMLFANYTLVKVCTAHELCRIAEITVMLTENKGTSIVCLETHKKRRSLNL